MTLSQEVISIVVIVSVCATLSVFCIIVWFCRCRQDHVRAVEDKHDRAVQMHNFEQEQKKNANLTAALKPSIKKLDASDVERTTESIRNSTKTDGSVQETLGQFENRMAGNEPKPALTGQCAANGTPIRNKRLDTISEIAMSSESLQRNDSKTNVFNLESRQSPMVEVDLNPGLESSIRLDKI